MAMDKMSKMGDDMMMHQHWKKHKIWRGIGMIVLGLLVMWNARMPFMDWGMFISWVLIVVGICNLAMSMWCCKKM